MPATPAMMRSRTGPDNESSLLEMTAEEKGGSDSDIALSVANEVSDGEQSNHSKKCVKLPEELDSDSSNHSELNNNSSNAINNNEINELITHRFSHEVSDKSSDNSSDEMTQNRDRMKNEPNESHNTLINVIEYNYLITL